MSVLPIVERELRERARWRSTYWVRGLTAFVATAIAMFVLMFMSGGAGAVGKGVMQVLAWLAFPFAVLEGLRNTADSLSSEKREGTLGLLFLTDLKGYDVVLGKFFASSLSSIYGLIAILPALAVPVLLGGVTGGEFWRLVLALLNALFFSLTAGTFISSISRNERRAWVATFVFIGLFVILIPTLSATFNQPWLSRFSPYTPFWLYDEAAYLTNKPLFWQALWIPHLLSWLWLALASFLLPRVWQETGGRRTLRPRAPETERVRRHRNQQLTTNPVWWLTSRNTHQRRWLWVIVILLCVVGVFAWAEAQGSNGALWALFGCAVAIHVALAIWVAFEACDSFSEARATGALELLLSTPLHVRQIVRGQHLALRELFLGPLALLVFVETCLVGAQIFLLTKSGAGAFTHIFIVLLLAFSLVWFVLELFAVAEVGMWFGLTSQKSTQALTKTVLLVVILPLALVSCCWPVAPGLMVAKCVIFFTWAQSKLENQFRRAATERFEKPKTAKWFRRGPQQLRMPGEA